MRDAHKQRTLREAHHEQTRDQIIEGLIQVMAEGAVTWSVPDVAREYGMPAVVNVPGAMQAIRAGQVIEVDVTTGRVGLSVGEN